MAYQVNKTSGPAIVVADRTLVPVAGSGVQLLGKNFGSYGEIMAENLVHLAEHFANSSAPSGTGNAAPLTGQIWYDTANKALKVYDGGWNAFYGTDATSLDYAPIKDSSSVYHQAIKIKVGGTIIAIISKDTMFVPNQDTGLVAAGFSSIKPGININGTMLNQDPVYKLRGRSIEAEFADMAEIYHSDIELQPGNIVKLGGAREITKTTSEFDNEIFGIISTQPGFLLNSGQQYEDLAYPVALKGRVPCIVKGTVRKGQRIVASDIAGVGMATDSFDPATIIGRAIGEKNSNDIGSVEVAVGVK